jgi:hypothetical protein
MIDKVCKIITASRIPVQVMLTKTDLELIMKPN